MVKNERIIVDRNENGSLNLMVETTKIETDISTASFSSLEKGIKQIKTEQWGHRVEMGISGIMGATMLIFGLKELVTGIDGIIHGIKLDAEHVYPGLLFVYFGSQALTMAKKYLDRQKLDGRKLKKLEQVNIG